MEDEDVLFEVIDDSSDDDGSGVAEGGATDGDSNSSNGGGNKGKKGEGSDIPTSFKARFLDHLWFDDVDEALAKHAYHERKKVSLCKANMALMRENYEQALALCDELRPLVTGKGELREWAETEARAALALKRLDIAIPAAKHRLCLVAQKTNFRNWHLLSKCYARLAATSADDDAARLTNYRTQSLIRSLAWLKFLHIMLVLQPLHTTSLRELDNTQTQLSSHGFVRDQRIRDEAELLAELHGVRPDIADMTCHDAMKVVQDELASLTATAIATAPDEIGRDYVEHVPPSGLAVDRDAFESEWFHTQRRLPDEQHAAHDDMPEPELPEKGPRTGN
ncbi:hypothetical protein PTSG_11560 [Salpingoeca rosetta]|uniref:Uncharacterized protein n=1 Tax=Salpingoeca rosetta (strain ATCC 50818 / BSB-021) TaxID=946362 RepID=F2TVV0_SALR5|nr:uncharacterized protein PTSG_11560 [Salpingoeca rosetta]EGD72196.1 hypothetical protein PTSG_11560 [Salpingoeca rosetta]|eukprot:XP_004998767.1 hypothetical protein PTSG_11560 [Salpingoeca rosetta]